MTRRGRAVTLGLSTRSLIKLALLFVAVMSATSALVPLGLAGAHEYDLASTPKTSSTNVAPLTATGEAMIAEPSRAIIGAFRGFSAAEETAGEAGYVYRGVASDHPGYEDALNGNAYPRNPASDVTAEEHNLGNTDSPFTSWTHDLGVARRYAGPDGAILRWPTGAPPAGASWSFEWSPDEYYEQEVLIRGPVEGAEVIRP